LWIGHAHQHASEIIDAQAAQGLEGGLAGIDGWVGFDCLQGLLYELNEHSGRVTEGREKARRKDERGRGERAERRGAGA
jgi:hypothetical protein